MARQDYELARLSADNRWSLDTSENRVDAWTDVGSTDAAESENPSFVLDDLSASPSLDPNHGNPYDLIDGDPFYRDHKDREWINAENFRKSQKVRGYPEVADTGVSKQARKLTGDINKELALEDISFFKKIKTEKNGIIRESYGLVESGSPEYELALQQFSANDRKVLIDNLNSIREKILDRGRHEDIQAWNDLSYVGITVGKIGTQERAVAFHSYDNGNFISGGMIAVNENWFRYETVDHKLFVIGHEFRHTMYGNCLYRNVKLESPDDSGGYEVFQVEGQQARYRLSRGKEGDARRWSQELLGYGDRDIYHSFGHPATKAGNKK